MRLRDPSQATLTDANAIRHLKRKSANSRSAVPSFLYLTSQQTAKSKSKIDNGQYGVEHVHVKYTFILTAFLHVFPPDLDLFEYDLEGVSPKVFAEAASLPSLVA